MAEIFYDRERRPCRMSPSGNIFWRVRKYRPAGSRQSYVDAAEWERHIRIMLWRYGDQEAEHHLAGTDEATAADLRAWNGIGRGLRLP